MIEYYVRASYRDEGIPLNKVNSDREGMTILYLNKDEALWNRCIMSRVLHDKGYTEVVVSVEELK